MNARRPSGGGHRARASAGERAPFPARVADTIRRYQMLEGGETVVIAASGGADSTALVHAITDLRLDLRLSVHLAHLNHALRPDAGEDAAFVSRMSAALGFPYHENTINPRALAAEEGLSLEDAGRRLRYEFLTKLADEIGADVVATGHTLDDQAETVLMRLLRGSGLEGLGAIPPVRDEGGVRIVRPLIEATRAEIEVYLKSRGVEWREDATNRDPAILRNRVRRSLLPALEGYNPNVRQALARLAGLVRDDAEALEMLADPQIAGTLSGGQGAVRIELIPFARLHVALQRRALRAAVQRVHGNLHSLRFVHLEQARQLGLEGHAGSWLSLPGGLRVTRLDGHLEMSAGVRVIKGPGEYRLPVPGRIVAIEFGVQLAAEELDDRDDQTDSHEGSGGAGRREILLDGGGLGESLILRGPRRGDRFAPAGMGGKTKTVADFLSDEKVARNRRAFTPVLTTDGGEIIWIVGLRAAEAARITPATTRVVRVRAWPLRA
jgi:tRNA(Ile)-lysidine synthase